ncbi:unnamed protein product [Parnassius mnemosyne]|uniref:RNA-directed DNA polymerase n=1 Tax=Parnassius mnemosyne TaxID=213953 RepID=A0AAV1LJ29_9NEOP
MPTIGLSRTNRMINNINNYYFWPSMSNDIKKYVKKCRSCQIQKFSNKNTQEPFTIMSTADSAFSRISIDTSIMGPLGKKSKYILTLQCDLSKFVEAYPLPRTDVETVPKSLVNNLILRYGKPKQILSDKGTDFTS